MRRRRRRLTLGFPPSVNSRWRRARGRTFVSHGERRYRKEVAAILRDRRFERLDGPVALGIRLHPPDRRRRDIDNVLKALIDALEYGGAFADDHQVARLHVERRHIVPGGRAVVEIAEVRMRREGERRHGRRRRRPTRRRRCRRRGRPRQARAPERSRGKVWFRERVLRKHRAPEVRE